MDKNQNLNSGGYDLYEISEQEWIFHTKNGSIFSGTFTEVVRHAVTKLNFEPEEFEEAVKWMIELDHNGAHFGMYRSFMFTFKREFKYDRQAS